MRLGRLFAGLLLLVGAALPAVAHEFWMLPSSFQLQRPGRVPVSLWVGEQFEGERVGIHAGLVASLRRHDAAGAVDLAAAVPDHAVADWPVIVRRAGTSLIALDTHPSSIELPADTFHAYLREEGLEFIVEARKKAGTAAKPARERYRRNLKALVRLGNQRDAVAMQRIGQKLEIVPLADPQRLPADGKVEMQVLFDGAPLPAALVKLWHRRDGQLLTIRARTRADGRVTATLPWTGVWMASVVHMVAAPDTQDFDWDSYWGNLMFQAGR
ncbi:DUF4198 domain-containing protein [Ramlibacter sp.]|uniref:DUF4198 domain-containing protein n=1 Tax=Ramlibacter sp. TaxID=1917967 RepID=UPI003D106BC0